MDDVLVGDVYNVTAVGRRHAERSSAWGMTFRRSLSVLLLGMMSACFSSAKRNRSYFVLQGVPTADQTLGAIDGLVRVRDLDSASIYEKFQIVVRRNPYELRYSEENVWAVKPNRMVSDIIAHSLAAGKQFSSVRRELGDLRPDYILGGDIEAIEVYDSGDTWYAHLSLGLSLSHYRTSETLLNYTFDQRKVVPNRTFAQAARALSELLSVATASFAHELALVKAPRVKLRAAPTVPRGRVGDVKSKNRNPKKPVAPRPISTDAAHSSGHPAENAPDAIFVPVNR